MIKKLSDLYNISSDVIVSGISVNSKDIKQGDIFVCIQGQNVDRHEFIEEAIKNGAVALVVKHEVNSSVRAIVVDNPNEELINLARKLYNYPDKELNMFGVTGTDGKTSVATIVSILIGNDKCGYIGTNGYSCSSFNKDTDNTTPAPEKLYKYFREFLDKECDSVSMELSSEAFAQGRLKEIEYDCIGITNITSEHLNAHKTLENYIKQKKEIMRLTKKDGYCILNHDDSHFAEVKEYCQSKILTYGKGKDNDLQILSYDIKTDKTLITFIYNDEKYNIVSPLLGEFNVYNLACALLMCLSLGHNINNLLLNVSKVKVPGRLEFLTLGQDYTVIIDYAHTRNGISKLLEFVKAIPHNKIITVTGQAGERDTSKRKDVGKSAADNSDLVVFCYEDPRRENPTDIINMMCEDIRDMSKVKIIVDRKEAIEYAVNIANKNDIVLILGKGNENYEKLKDKVIYFNDIEEAKKAIEKRIEKEKGMLNV